MMTGKRIKVTIDPVGRPTIDAQGFVGTSCQAATKPIEDALAEVGGELVVTEKPELNQLDMGGENHNHLQA